MTTTKRAKRIVTTTSVLAAPTGDVNFISTFSPDDTFNIKAYPLEYALNGGSGVIPNEQ